jgi:hypothetical protein
LEVLPIPLCPAFADWDYVIDIDRRLNIDTALTQRLARELAGADVQPIGR